LLDKIQREEHFPSFQQPSGNALAPPQSE